MIQLNNEQIEWLSTKIAHAVKQAVTTALQDLNGTDPSEERNKRLEARILAALARSATYVASYPKLKPILEHKALTRTLLRRAMGGNAVTYDDVLNSMIERGLVKHYPSTQIAGPAVEVFQLVNR